MQACAVGWLPQTFEAIEREAIRRDRRRYLRGAPLDQPAVRRDDGERGGAFRDANSIIDAFDFIRRERRETIVSVRHVIKGLDA